MLVFFLVFCIYQTYVSKDFICNPRVYRRVQQSLVWQSLHGATLLIAQCTYWIDRVCTGSLLNRLLNRIAIRHTCSNFIISLFKNFLSFPLLI